MSNLYFGIKKVPKGKKQATMKEAIDNSQVSFWGLNKVDKLALKSKNKETKMTRNQIIMKQVSLRGMRDKIKIRDIRGMHPDKIKQHLLDNKDTLAKIDNELNDLNKLLQALENKNKNKEMPEEIKKIDKLVNELGPIQLQKKDYKKLLQKVNDIMKVNEQKNNEIESKYNNIITDFKKNKQIQQNTKIQNTLKKIEKDDIVKKKDNELLLKKYNDINESFNKQKAKKQEAKIKPTISKIPTISTKNKIIKSIATKIKLSDNYDNHSLLDQNRELIKIANSLLTKYQKEADRGKKLIFKKDYEKMNSFMDSIHNLNMYEKEQLSKKRLNEDAIRQKQKEDAELATKQLAEHTIKNAPLIAKKKKDFELKYKDAYEYATNNQFDVVLNMDDIDILELNQLMLSIHKFIKTLNNKPYYKDLKLIYKHTLDRITNDMVRIEGEEEDDDYDEDNYLKWSDTDFYDYFIKEIKSALKKKYSKDEITSIINLFKPVYKKYMETK